MFCDAPQVTPVHAVEPAPIDIEPPQRRVCSRRIDPRQPLDSGKVADPAQQADRDPRGAARTPRDLGGAIGLQLDCERASAAADDLFELGRLIENEAQGNAEPLP